MRSGAFALVFDKERGAGRRRGFAWARCAPKVASALPTPGRIAGQDGYVAGCPCRQPMVAIWSQNEKEATPRAWYNLLISCGRSDWIRTSDPLLPKQVRYQTAPRSAAVAIGQSAGLGKPGLLRPVRRKQRKTPRKRGANFWGERRGLNPRPPGPQPGALPTELLPPCEDKL